MTMVMMMMMIMILRGPKRPPGDQVRPADQPDNKPTAQPLRLHPPVEPNPTEVPAADGGLPGLCLLACFTSHCQEDFILDQMERANLSAAVVLDNTARSQWRVSSLQGKLFQPSLAQMLLGGTSVRQLPVLLVRADDWRPHQDLLRQPGGKIHLSWSTVSRDLLGRELRCSEGNILTLSTTEGPQAAHHCQAGKFLNSSGQIVERLCVRSSCTKFGGKCPTQFDFPLGQFSMEVKCELPSVSPYQFLTSGESQSPVSSRQTGK